MLIFGRRNSFMKWIIFDYLPANVDSFASLNYSMLILGRRSFKKWVRQCSKKNTVKSKGRTGEVDSEQRIKEEEERKKKEVGTHLGTTSEEGTKVVVAKYGMDHGDWSTMNVRGSHGCGLWKGVSLGRGEFWEQVYFRVGSGVRVWFWKVQWCSMEGVAGPVPIDFSSCDRSGCGGGFLYSVDHLLAQCPVASYLWVGSAGRSVRGFVELGKGSGGEEASEGLGFGSPIFIVAHLAGKEPSYFPRGCLLGVLVGIKISLCFVRLGVCAGAQALYLCVHALAQHSIGVHALKLLRPA
ncbi:hypothetical protein ACSBR1_019393 [Camellia fascicularis]